MTSKYAGLNFIAARNIEKQAQILQIAKGIATKALPWAISKLGPKAVQLASGLEAGARVGHAAIKATPWTSLARPAGRMLWEGSMLAGGIGSGVDALRDTGHGLKQIWDGDTGEGAKSIGRGALNALFSTMAVSPIAKGMGAVGNMARTAQRLRGTPQEAAKAMGRISRGPAMRPPTIRDQLKDFGLGTNTAQKRPPTSTSLLAHRIEADAAMDPQLGALLAKMHPDTARNLISRGKKLDAYSNSAGIMGLLGTLGLNSTLAERDYGQEDGSSYSHPARYRNPVVDFDEVYRSR